MTENSMTENVRDTSLTKEEIAHPSTEGEIIGYPIEFINDCENKKLKDKNAEASSMFEEQIDTHPSPASAVICIPLELANNSNDIEMTEVFKMKKSSDSSGKEEITAAPSTSSKIVSNPVAFVNNCDNVEMKDKLVDLTEIGILPASEREIVAGPSITKEAFKSDGFKQKGNKEGIKNAVASRSRVPAMIIDSLDKCDEGDGVSLAYMKGYIAEKFNVHVDILKSQIIKYLKKGEERGIFVRIRGENGVDRYKIKKVVISEEEITAAPSTSSEIISNPVAFVINSDKVEKKGMRIDLSETGILPASEREIVVGPSTTMD